MIDDEVSVTNAYFRFTIELAAEVNPPGTMDRLREDMRAWIVTRGLGYGMGAMGGSFRCYGHIGPQPPASEGDRNSLVEWLLCQRMYAKVMLGSVEGPEPPDLLAPITDLVFEVDNLTDADREVAAACHSEARRRIAALHARSR